MKKAISILLVIVLFLGTTAISLADSVKVHDSGDAYLFNQAGEIWGRAKAGKTYELLETSGIWYKIRLENGTEGWIATDTAEIIKNDSGNSENPTETAESQETTDSTAIYHEETLIQDGEWGQKCKATLDVKFNNMIRATKGINKMLQIC